jgi:prepilin signal peptidase PulO-like enzyme (type II secretory pathway)
LILGFVLFALFGAVAAVVILAAFGRTSRSREGTFSGGALGFLGSASLSSFILVAAFLIAGSWSNLNTARGHTFDESRALNAAYTDADPTTRPLLRQYVTSVIGGEWTTMEHGSADPATWKDLDSVRAHVVSLESPAARTQELTDLTTVYTTRQIRLADTQASLPAPLYPALIATGLLVLLYAPIAGLTFHLRESVALGLVGAVVGFGIYMVLHMTHPYAGPIHVTPVAYTQSLARFAQLSGG